MAMTADSHARLREVDVLRGLAALAVLFSHYFPYWDRYAEPIPVLVPNAVGYYAVGLFFVISGFVIFMTLERCRTVADFVLLRFSRLYPVYWVSLAVVAALSVCLFGQSFWLGGFLANATMFQQFLGITHLDNVYWSLSVELTFYVIVAALFALGLHKRVHLFLFAWLALAALWVLAFQTPGRVTAWDVVATDQRDMVALLSAFDYCPYFAIGIAFHHATRAGWTVKMAAVVACALAVQLLLAGWESLAIASAFTLLFGLAIGGWLRFLVNRVTLWLGTISYSLYLTHRNLGYYSLTWLHEHGVEAFTAIALVAAGALALATAFAYGVERPASAVLRAWYDSRRGSRTGSSAHAHADRV